MTWQIQFAYRDRDESVADVLIDQRALPAEQRPVARALLLELATTSGIDTAGDALDLLDRATPDQRRRLLDAARQACGLPDTATAQARAEFEALQATLPPVDTIRDPKGRIPAVCAAEGCRNFEADPNTGRVALVAVKKYWCAEHSAQAAPGDLLPYAGPRLAYSRSGAIVDLDEREAEAAKQAERRKHREAELEARRREREAEREQLRQHEQAIAESFRPANLISATTPDREGNPR